MTVNMNRKTNSGKRKYSLRFKLTAAFLALTLLLFSLIGIFVNFLLEKQFENYVIDKITQRNSSIAIGRAHV